MSGFVKAGYPCRAQRDRSVWPATSLNDDVDPSLSQAARETGTQLQFALEQLSGRARGLHVDIDITPASGIVDPRAEYVHTRTRTENARDFLAYRALLLVR